MTFVENENFHGFRLCPIERRNLAEPHVQPRLAQYQPWTGPALLVVLRRNAAKIWMPANRYRRRGENFRLDVPSKARNAAAFLPDRRSGNFPARLDDATSLRGRVTRSFFPPLFPSSFLFRRDRDRERRERQRDRITICSSNFYK